jgi:hypothetical protein
MPSGYAAALDAFLTTYQDDTDAKSGLDLGTSTTTGVHAQHHNDLSDAVNKIEAELGVNPSATFLDVATRLNMVRTVRKTADESFTTQVLANVADMSFAVAANTDYEFRFVRVAAGVTIYGQAADGVAAGWLGVINASADAVISTAAAATTEQVALIEGVLRPTAAGTLQLQARQGGGATAANAVVKQSSWAEMVQG